MSDVVNSCSEKLANTTSGCLLTY